MGQIIINNDNVNGNRNDHNTDRNNNNNNNDIQCTTVETIRLIGPCEIRLWS